MDVVRQPLHGTVVCVRISVSEMHHIIVLKIWIINWLVRHYPNNRLNVTMLACIF